MENRFKPGDIVQHFKREMLSDEERAANKYLYEIVGIATHSETRESMMVYRPLYDDGGMYVRQRSLKNRNETFHSGKSE